MEGAQNLITESFILALNCFRARKGHVRGITIDNGSGFIGAEAELRESINNLNNKKISHHVNKKCKRCSSNPPLSSCIAES